MDLVMLDGHGPSRGPLSGYVVGFASENPPGERADALVCSGNCWELVAKDPRGGEPWLYARPGLGFRGVRWPEEELGRWCSVYEALAVMPKGKNPKFSRGFAGLVMAASLLKPRRIVLNGFDNMRGGNNGWYKSLTDGGHMAAHDYACERSLVPAVENRYGVKVAFA